MAFAHKIALATLLAASLIYGQPATAQTNLHAEIGGPFALKNARGETVTEKDLLGKLSLVYFGYTNCLMQCPPTWITLDRVKQSLGKDAGKVNVYFISIDPARDTVDALAAWQRNWPNTIALTGNRQQVESIANAFHIFFAKRPMHAMSAAMMEMKRIRQTYGKDDRIKWNAKKPAGYYMVDHTTHTFLLDRQGKYLTHFSLEIDAKTILKVVRKHL